MRMMTRKRRVERIENEANKAIQLLSSLIGHMGTQNWSDAEATAEQLAEYTSSINWDVHRVSHDLENE